MKTYTKIILAILFTLLIPGALHAASLYPAPDEGSQQRGNKSQPSLSSVERSKKDSPKALSAKAQRQLEEILQTDGSAAAGPPIGGGEIQTLNAVGNRWLNSYADDVRLPQAAPNSGAFVHTIPIFTPPGRSGIEPNLSLKYNSQDANPENIFGYGWSIDIPYIERMNKTGTDDMYSQVYFVSSMDGELATTSTSNVYGAKFDGGSFLEYTLPTVSSYWTVVDKFGTEYLFGTSTDARLVDPSDSTRVFRWMLQQVQDTNGNTMTFEYTKDNGQVYPSKIKYTANGSSEAPFEVVFTTEARPEDVSSYMHGFEVQTNYRISDISIKFDGSEVHHYDLGYITGHNSSRSLLETVIESGVGDSGTTTLPSLKFSYQTENISWASSTPSNSLPDLADSSGGDLGFRVFQHGSNGASSLARFATSTPSKRYQGPSWGENNLPNNYPVIVDANNFDRGGGFADVNGDGYLDVVLSKLGPITYDYQEVYLWNPSTSEYDVYDDTTFDNIPVYNYVDGSDYGIRFGDFNGDGYADYMRLRGGWTRYLYINKADGTGWENGYSLPGTLSVQFADSTGDDTGARVADVNGDGLDDIIRKQVSDTWAEVFINQGDGTTWERTLVSSSNMPDTVADDGTDIGTRVMDVDGDGLADLVVSSVNRGVEFHINNGNGLSYDEQTIGSIPYFLDGDEEDIGTRIIDGNDDGIPDFVTSNSSTELNYLSSGNPVDTLISIEYPAGGDTDVAYSGTRVGSSLFQTVDTITHNDGFGGASNVETYEFADGVFITDYLNRKFAGFGSVRVIDGVGNGTQTFYHQGNGTGHTGWPLGELNDSESRMYHPWYIEQFTSSGATSTLTFNVWDTKSLGDGRELVYLQKELTLNYDGDSDHKDSAVEYDYSASTGNLTTKTELGEVTAGETGGKANGTYTDTGSDKRTTDYSYATDGDNIIGLVSQETLKNNGGSKVAEIKTYYDSQSHGSVTTGNPTKRELWKTGLSYASTTKAYNSFGLVTSEDDANGNTTTYVYDALNLYPATTTNAESHQTEVYYNYSYGVAKEIHDVNDRVFQTTYDGLGRVLTEKQPDISSPTSLVTKRAFTYTDTKGAKSVLETNYLDGSTNFLVYTYLDGLDRKIQTRKEAETANQYAVRDFIYDTRGLLWKESLPYFSSGLSRTSATTNTDLLSVYSYDANERISTVATVVGTTTNSYDQWITTVTDPKGNYIDSSYDAYGNLVQVVEHKDASSYTTQYTYDTQNKLTKITDASANIRNFTYDGLGRRLTAQDLHDTADGTYGTWTYTYDDAGNLISHTDPKSQTVNFSYDGVNRVLTENYTGQGGVEVLYDYDNCTEGVGRLCVATSTGSVSSYAYNAVGLVANETVNVDSTNYTTTFDYDRQGNITNVTYPDSSEVAYTYNTAGLVETIQQKESGESLANIVTDFDYGPTGQVTYKAFANGVESTYTYDAGELYRLKNILTTASTTGGGGGGLGFTQNLFRSFADASNEYLPLAFRPLLLGEEGYLALGEVETTTSTPPTIIEIDEEVAPAGEEIATTTTSEASIEIEEATPTVEVVDASDTPNEEEDILNVEGDETGSSEEESTATTTETTGGSVLDDGATTTPEIEDAVFGALEESEEIATSTNDTPVLVESVSEETIATTTEGQMLIESTYTEEQQIEDARINPYIEKADRYIFNVNQTLSNAGKASIELVKDRPEIRLKKWNGEINLGLRYDGVRAHGERAFLTDRMEWKGNGNNDEVHAYPLPPTDQMEDGGFEFEVMLTKKPQANAFDFYVDGGKNLDFFYQPPLNEEKNVGTASCTETQCFDAEGNVVIERPENIIGSYAVYHKDKQNYEVGEINYGTGKVAHIYRPKAIDANGNEVWGDLSYTNGVLTVTIPRSFFETASYPVRVDPTLGFTSVGSTQTGYLADRIMLGGATASGAGIVETIHFFTHDQGDQGQTDVGYSLVYADKLGVPDSLVAASGEFEIPATSTSSPSGSWTVEEAVEGGKQFSSGTKLWIGHTQNAGAFNYDSTGGYSYYLADNITYDSPPAHDPYDWGGSEVSNKRLSAYITYLDALVLTENATNITDTSATLNGTLDNVVAGGMDIGFVYGTNGTFSATTTVETATTSIGSFSANVSSLSTFEKYNFAAFAESGSDLIYGDTYYFFTGDISTSTPIASGDNYAGDNSSWEDGSHASTTSAVGGELILTSSGVTEGFEGSFPPNHFAQGGPFDPDDADWFKSSSVAQSGTYSAASGDVSDGERTSFSFTAPNDGSLSFYWKVSSEFSFDLLCWYINDPGDGSGEQDCITGEVGWTQVNAIVSEGDEITWDYSKDGSVSEGSDMGWVDTIVLSGDVATESFEGSFPPTGFSHYGFDDANWFKSSNQAHTGTYSAESGDINDGEYTVFIFNPTTDGALSFYWKVSSEEDFDYLCWYYNFEQQDCISGSTSWAPINLTVSNGDEVAWLYSKDGSVSSGSDAGWVDIVQYPEASSFDDTGYWISPAWSVGSITNVDDSIIEFASTTPSDTSITVKTAINSSATSSPASGDFDMVVSGGKIQTGNSGGNISGDLTGKYVWVRVDLNASTDNSSTPTFTDLYLGINNGSTGGGTSTPVDLVQDITFVYDAVGNIIGITDTSDTGAGKTLVFSYDDLYRLTAASTTVASSTPYRHQFDYSALGNILGLHDGTATTTYSYAETGYANPHAPTSVGGVTHGYDNNGNLITAGTNTYTWDYNNRLTQTVGASATTTYAYNHSKQRVTKNDGTMTTTYPNRYYNTTGSKETKHIFSPNGELIATITTESASTTKQYLHSDHLGGTNVVTDENGNTVQTLDYYPYGSDRISTGSFSEQRTFIGEERDTETDLSYLNARYYDPERGQFLSQDPVFQNLGTDSRTSQVLIDPQLANAYTYARNNPVLLKDSDGEFVQLLLRFAPYILRGLGSLGVGYAGGEVLNSEVLFRENYSDAEREENRFNLALRSATFVASPQLNTPIERAVLGVGPSVANKLDPYRNTTRTNTSQTTQSTFSSPSITYSSLSSDSQPTYSSLLNTGYTSTQSTAIVDLGSSFGITSFTQEQLDAIQAVKDAFSN